MKAIQIASLSGPLATASGIALNFSADFTKGHWFQVNGSLTTFVNAWMYGAFDYTTPYLELRITSANEAVIRSDMGSGATSSAGVGLTPGDWNHLAVRYTASLHKLELVLNGVTVSNLTKDLSTMTPSLEILGDTVGADDIPVSVDQEGLWQVSLSDAQILAQMRSQNPLYPINRLRWTSFDGLANLGSWVPLGPLQEVDGPAPSGDLCIDLSCRSNQLQWMVHRFDAKYSAEGTS